MRLWEKGLPAHPELDAGAMNGEGLPPRNVPYALYSMMAGAYSFSDANATLTGKLTNPHANPHSTCAGGAAEPDTEARTPPLRYTIERYGCITVLVKHAAPRALFESM